jgi:hypothetical protein
MSAGRERGVWQGETTYVLLPVSWQAALALAVPALVAVAGYLLTYRNNLRLAERKDRLDRVTHQLSDFYGPLLALSNANQAAWRVFRTLYRSGVPGFWDDPPPTDDEAAAWRLWMVTVFMPLNREMRDLVVRRADLLDEAEVPEGLLDLCAHVAAYEAVLNRWQAGDFAEHRTPLNFPAEAVASYASSRFKHLKAEQNRLLRRK